MWYVSDVVKLYDVLLFMEVVVCDEVDVLVCFDVL